MTTRYLRRDPAEVQPWAEALVQRRLEDLGTAHMSHQCLPWGPNYSTSQRRAKIVQSPSLIVILDEDLTYRQIFLDGRWVDELVLGLLRDEFRP